MVDGISLKRQHVIETSEALLNYLKKPKGSTVMGGGRGRALLLSSGQFDYSRNAETTFYNDTTL